MAISWRDRPALATGAAGPVGGRLVEAGADVVRLVRDGVPRGDCVDRALTGRVPADHQVRPILHPLLVNSGSSANLVALSSLTSPRLGERRLRPGDEVITVAAGFPTTVNPILQCGLVPVFVDVRIPTYNIDPAQLDAALSGRTR